MIAQFKNLFKRTVVIKDLHLHFGAEARRDFKDVDLQCDIDKLVWMLNMASGNRIGGGDSPQPAPQVKTAAVGEPKPKKGVGKADDKKAQNGEESKMARLHRDIKMALIGRFAFRYNLISEQTEFRPKDDMQAEYRPVTQRDLNTLSVDMQDRNIDCWDKDVKRIVNSKFASEYHPFIQYMDSLPEWDGEDRLTPLAERVSHDALFVSVFRKWMTGMASQWMGRAEECVNAMTPILISERQGMRKSTFCQMLMPGQLRTYYTDSFDIQKGAEQDLGSFGLINLDEFDKFRPGRMALLKNLLQMNKITIKKAHRSTYSHLPRIASFIGTSNVRELLVDHTGSRRFFCVEVDHKIDCSPIEYAQLYAQLKFMVEHGERYWYTAEEEEEINRHNKQFYHQSPAIELFYEYFRKPDEEGEFTEMTAASIFSHLQRKCPSVMRETTVTKLARTLTAMGFERRHKVYGNVYRVAKG